MTSGMTNSRASSTRKATVAVAHTTVPSVTTPIDHTSQRYCRRSRPLDRRNRTNRVRRLVATRTNRNVNSEPGSGITDQAADSGMIAYGFGTSMPKALPDGVMLTTGATAISTAHAIDMANQAIATGRVRSFGSEPLGNTNARASRQTNANPQPVPFAQTVNDSNDVVVPATIAGMEPLTITLPRASPTPISTRSQAMGWRGRRAARTRPVLEYATSRTIPAGATMNRLPTNRMATRRPDATARSRQVPRGRGRPTGVAAIAPPRVRRGRRSCRGRRRPAAWTRSTGTGPRRAWCTGSSGRRGGTAAGARPGRRR